MTTSIIDSNSAGDMPVSEAERLVVLGGESIRFALAVGDRVTIRDPEGLQPGILSLAGETRALFGPESLAGSTFSFEADADCAASLAAPGGTMAPDAQDAPTELHVEIRRRHPTTGFAPPPLAEPKLDLRVKAATAEAYYVAAGDYIQIIDVEGRQCSDFLAFDAAALAAGEEYGLNATTTRTILGNAFPGPGLHSKYFDERMRPLVEVVRDTVGRHDTFMLACSSKYYDDMGYPGHANCTDNFNRALARHGVRERKGWPAINFFYNTWVDHADAIHFDEPWSRPGDYVLLRALTDLVCASSSCADDIDPANGWNPTDIHVRVYDADTGFSKGTAHRMTADSAPRLTRETGFHSRTSALTRNFEAYRGFWLPTCFTEAGPIAEYWACRERAVVMDLSALRKFEVTGPDAERLMQLAVPRDISKLAVGQIVYTAMCYDHGGMVDDGTIFRLGEHNFRFVCGDDYSGIWLRELAAKHGLKAWVRSSTEQLHNLAVQGPKSREILAGLVMTPPHVASLAELKWFRFTSGRIADRPVVVSRTGYTGELGYEIWCHPDAAPNVWDAIWTAGQPHGLTPLGLTALDMVRIEAGLVFAGYDFNDQTDPFEAGIGFSVPAGKTDSYVGDAALKRHRENPRHNFVGLDVAGNDAVGHGDPLFIGRAQIGVVTSATRSPILGKIIALARVDSACGTLGAALEIGKLDGHQKRIPATIVRFPHFDPEKSRVRA